MTPGIEQALMDALGKPFRCQRAEPVGGGSINQAFRLEGESGERFFLKLNTADALDMFEAEYEGLRELAAPDAIRIPAPITTGVDGDHSYLILEYLELRPPRRGSEERLGEQLAELHQTTAQQYGWFRDNTIGSTPQPNPRESDWPAFFARHRLGFQLDLAEQRGLDRGTLDAGRDLARRLPDLFTDYRPVPSLLHGDLWGGNVGYDNNGAPVLFDPAVYYGDRETDIAMTELFGGFGPAFYDAYRAAWPLDAGYAARRDLYRLYHVLNHFNLFGGGYGAQVGRLIRSVLAELG